jgi:hypothetical protein
MLVGHQGGTAGRLIIGHEVVPLNYTRTAHVSVRMAQPSTVAAGWLLQQGNGLQWLLAA